MRAAGGKTVEITPHTDDSVHLEAEALADDLMARDTPVDRLEQTWLKKQCFRRDDYRCVILGDVDTNEQDRYPDDMISDTNCAHIIPLSLGDYKSNESAVANIWVAIRRYFPDIMETRMQPDELNVPENAMTLASYLHIAFGRFNFSFDSIVSLSWALLCIYILMLHRKERRMYT